MSTIVRKYDLNIVNEDDPKKWGLWNVDPAKRKGRYDIQVGTSFCIAIANDQLTQLDPYRVLHRSRSHSGVGSM